MLKPETSVDHLNQAGRLITAAIQELHRSPSHALTIENAREFCERAMSHLLAVQDAEIKCDCAADKKSPRHLISCPLRHAS
jgi:hypothetical protein